MRCPYCGCENTQVKDSRPTEENQAIRRRRNCEHRFGLQGLDEGSAQCKEQRSLQIGLVRELDPRCLLGTVQS